LRGLIFLRSWFFIICRGSDLNLIECLYFLGLVLLIYVKRCHCLRINERFVH